jgi:hypothetical protein
MLFQTPGKLSTLWEGMQLFIYETCVCVLARARVLVYGNKREINFITLIILLHETQILWPLKHTQNTKNT